METNPKKSFGIKLNPIRHGDIVLSDKMALQNINLMEAIVFMSKVMIVTADIVDKTCPE